MGMAQRKAGPVQLTFRAMLSLDPATIIERYYPELFQVGETAFGHAIVDGQHLHDFFMELAVLYDHRIKIIWLLSFYVAPVGDPALGPTAFPTANLLMKTLLHLFDTIWKTPLTSLKESPQ